MKRHHVAMGSSRRGAGQGEGAGVRRRRRAFRHLQMEPLEQRLMLDGDLPGIVVGRILSSYSVAGIANGRLSLTYTVYNEQADPVSGVLLTTTLQPGVTFQGASLAPDRDGQDLAWSLGTIGGFGRASVDLTVSLTTPTPLQIDTGAHAFATLDAGLVSDATAPASLRPGAIAANLITPTPDANTTDPFIQEKAAALDYDPQAIFNYLHTQVGYNSYSGSLRGARGTLWSGAGDALDVASLGVALMRASGIPAQYAQGSLPFNQAQQLILSMFSPSFQTVGFIPQGTQTAAPQNDSRLINETVNHAWFQFDTGAGMKDADPLMPGAAVGQTFATATGTFSEVPDNLRAKTQVQLVAEIFTQAAALFGLSGLSTTTVLDQTFNDVDLVGKPLSIGNYVRTSSIGSPIFSSTTNTYSPYIQVGDAAFPDPRQDQTITGQDYQEVLTNFPLGSQVLTGLFLKTTTSGPGVSSQTYERALVDRIGFAARQGGAGSPLPADPGAPPAITDSDIVTLYAVPGLSSPGAPTLDAQVLDNLGQRAAALQALDATAQNAQFVALLRESFIEQTRAVGDAFLRISDGLTNQLADSGHVKAYADQPRIILVSARISSDLVAKTSTATLSIDLRSDLLRSLAFPGQNPLAAPSYNTARGVAESVAESEVPGMLLATAQPLTPALSTTNIFAAAQDQGIGLTSITGATLGQLDALAISPEAKARITQAVSQGHSVIVPTRSVNLNGKTTVGWYEIDPATGNAIGVTEDGGHLSILSWTILGGASVFALAALAYGFTHGGTLGDLGNSANDVGKGVGDAAKNAPSLIAAIKKSVARAIATLIDFIPNSPAAVVNYLNKVDPPVGGFLFGFPDFSVGRANQGSAALTVPGTVGAGPVQGSVAISGLQVAHGVSATWDSGSATGFLASALNAPGATVRDATGATLGTGAVALASAAGVPLAISGTVSYSVNGQGSLSFYGPAESSLGLSANWDSYTATVAGSVVITIRTAGLTLNGQALPDGTYTIVASSATLSGSGPSASPNFSGLVSLNLVGGTVALGPGGGNLVVGGVPLDLTGGATLTGYTGKISVAAGGGNHLDAVTLDGNATDLLQLSAAPALLTTDQNTPVTLQARVDTSSSGAYELAAQAPAGWTVALDAGGKLTVIPAPGLQGGTFPILIVARSAANPDLVARSVVNVTLTPTLPGIALAVIPDPLLTVPLQGAQVPSAYQAIIHNSGPAADTFNLSFANVPAGFTIPSSGTSVTIPAGQTAIVGLYLQPSGTLPAPGTQVSFDVTATSATDRTITQTQHVMFTVPAIEALAVTSNPTALGTTPGVPITATITITNVGNVPEPSVALTSTQSAGLSVVGLAPVALAVGQSTTQTVTLVPDASTPLNSMLQTTISASFGPAGAPLSKTLTLPVRVTAPGVQSLAAAATAAGQVGNAGLANRLSDLTTALTNLFQDPTNPVYNGQATASLDSLISQATHDPFLTPFVAGLTAARTALPGATTAAALQPILTNLGSALGALAQSVADEAAHGFTLGLLKANLQAQPQAPAVYTIILKNTGNQATTYDLSVAGLPAGINAAFSQAKVMLQPGQQTATGGGAVTLSLTETGASLIPADFTVIATAEGAPEITNSTPGALSVRSTFLQVANVTVDTGFVAPGGQAPVTAKIQSALNQPQADTIGFVVRDATGKTVFTSTPVPLALDVNATLTTASLGNLSAVGLPDGPYTLVATIFDAKGAPIPGSVGQGTVIVGLPLTGSVTTATATVPTGGSTVTTTVQVHSLTAFPAPLTILGQVATMDNELSTVLYGNSLAYEVGNNGISIIDVSDRANPKLLSTFATDTIVKGGGNVAQVVGNTLFVASTVTLNANGFQLIIYDLSNPLSPTLVSNTSIPFRFFAGMFILGNVALFPLQEFDFFPAGANTTYFGQQGNVLSVDISDLAHPRVLGTLFPSNDPHPENGAVIVNNQVAYTLTTGNTGGNTSVGPGRLLLLDIANPAAPKQTGTLDIPGTNVLTNLTLQGNRALVVGSTGGQLQPFDFGKTGGLTGNVTLTVLDTSDPANPRVLGNTLVTEATSSLDATLPPGRRDLVDLGNGLFALSNILVNGKPVLMLIDASDPDNIIVSTVATPGLDNGLTVSGNTLFVSTPTGLATYDIGALVSSPISIAVEVPKDGPDLSLVPNSFNKPPTQIVSGATSDIYIWNRSLAFGNTDLTFTWQTHLSNLDAGDSPVVTLGTAARFDNQGTPASIVLPGTTVTAVPIVVLTPATLTEQPGGTATFNVRLNNPTDTQVTYFLGLQGLPFSAQFETSSVTLAPNSSTDVRLRVTSNANTSAGAFPFTVTASDSRGNSGQGQASGSLTVAGAPIPAADPVAHGVVVALTSAQPVAGQGNAARYVIRVTNTGSAEETFNLSAVFPPTVDATFGQQFVDLQPGASNFIEIPLTLTPAPGTAPGSFPITITATSGARPDVKSVAAGTLVVTASGVSVDLTPSSTTPGSPFQVRVTNTGSVADSFDLALAGPGALAASLGTTRVTLDPGASQMVPIATGPVGFSAPGNLNLFATATSVANPDVRDAASADLVIGNTTGLDAHFDQPIKVVPLGGTTTFLLLVSNLGNTEDTFTAVLTGTTGPITASLIGLDGLPAQSIPSFQLPGLGTGAIMVRVNSASMGEGTVTVLVRSTTDPTRSVSATARVSATTIATTTQLSAVPDPATAGRLVTFTAVITPALDTGSLAPTGTVVFTIDGQAQPPVPVSVVNGVAQATLTTLSLAPGTHQITAAYSGDASFNASQTAAPLALTVNVGPELLASQTFLFVAPSPASIGQPVTLSVLVRGLPGGLPPTGSVTFTVDGVAQPPLPLQVQTDFAVATLVLSTLSPGPHTITAAYSGDAVYAASVSAPASLVVGPPLIGVGPRVVDVQRFGFHAQPTVLVLHFDRPLDATRAQDPRNYRITDPHGHRIAIARVTYDPATLTVRLHPRQRLDVHRRYHLTINGQSPSGLTDLQGNLLDGANNGRPGSDFVHVINRHTLVLGLPRDAFTPRRHTTRHPHAQAHRPATHAHSHPRPHRPSSAHPIVPTDASWSVTPRVLGSPANP